MEVGVEEVFFEAGNCGGIGEGDVEFLADAEAHFVEVGGTDAGPAVVNGGFDVGHPRKDIDAGAIFEEFVSGDLIGGLHEAAVVVGREDDADVHAAAAGLDECAED